MDLSCFFMHHNAPGLCPFPGWENRVRNTMATRGGYSRLRVMKGVTPHLLYREKNPDSEMHLMQEQGYIPENRPFQFGNQNQNYRPAQRNKTCHERLVRPGIHDWGCSGDRFRPAMIRQKPVIPRRQAVPYRRRPMVRRERKDDRTSGIPAHPLRMMMHDASANTHSEGFVSSSHRNCRNPPEGATMGNMPRSGKNHVTGRVHSISRSWWRSTDPANAMPGMLLLRYHRMSAARRITEKRSRVCPIVRVDPKRPGIRRVSGLSRRSEKKEPATQHRNHLSIFADVKESKPDKDTGEEMCKDIHRAVLAGEWKNSGLRNKREKLQVALLISSSAVHGFLQDLDVGDVVLAQ